jgi:hypothetical protein
LSAFLHFGYDHFPAEHYLLILWDHGSGSLGGCCHDFHNGKDSLSTAELVRALDNSPCVDTKLELLGFDACLMSAMETACAVEPYAVGMVASENNEPSEGWNYAFLKGLEKDTSPADTGRRIAELYQDVMIRNYPASEYPMACVDLGRLHDLVRSLDQYFDDVTVTANNFGELKRARAKMLTYGNESSKWGKLDLVDIRSLMQSMMELKQGDSEKAKSTLDALDRCITCIEPGKKACGLSVYFPHMNLRDLPAFMKDYQSFNQAASYKRFISDFGQYASSRSGAWASLSTEMEPAKAAQSLYVVTLNEEQLEEFCEAELVVFQAAEDVDGFHQVAAQEAEIDWDAGKLRGEYVHVNLFVTDAEGIPLHGVPITYALRDDGMVEFDVELVDSQNKHTSARLVCRQGEKLNENAVEWIVDHVCLYDSAIDGYSPRLCGNLADYVSIVYQVENRRETRDETGMLLPFEEWELVSAPEYEWKLDGEWRLAFVNDYLEASSLKAAFAIMDIYNCFYLSTLSAGSEPGLVIVNYTNYSIDDCPVRINDASFNPDTKWFSASVVNHTDSEVILVAQNITVNGQPIGTPVEVHGLGDHSGLMPEEAAGLNLSIQTEEALSGQTLSFEIVLFTPNAEQLSTVTVEVQLPA